MLERQSGVARNRQQVAVRDEQLQLVARNELTEPLLQPSEAAALLSVRPSWIYEAVRAGRLPHIRIGRHIRFSRSDLERWVDAHRADAGAAR
jgi:excisionase family DNA binding protein